MNVPLRLEHTSGDRGLRLRPTRSTWAWLAMSILMLMLMLTPGFSAAEDKKPPFITGFLDMQFSDKYLTSRGVYVENSGLVFQPTLAINANLFQSSGPISNVTASLGVWNSIHSKTRTTNTTTPNWNELDFFSALSVTFLKAWTFIFDYEYWLSPIDAFPPASLIQLKLHYGDSFLKGVLPPNAGSLSLNPHAKFFIELHNKTASAISTDESFYFEIGITPKYVFAGYPLSLELPTYVQFPGNNFYSQDSTVGVFRTGLRATAPLTFIQERYGKWSVRAEVVYKHLANDGVVFENATLLPPGSDTRNPVQFRGGITLNF